MVGTGRRRDGLFNSEPLPADLETAYLNSPLQFALHRRSRNGRRSQFYSVPQKELIRSCVN